MLDDEQRRRFAEIEQSLASDPELTARMRKLDAQARKLERKKRGRTAAQPVPPAAGRVAASPITPRAQAMTGLWSRLVTWGETRFHERMRRTHGWD